MNLEEMISRAWTDFKFKQRLLSDPKLAIEEALGVSLPAELTIQVHEETPTTLHLVLPRPPEDLPSSLARNRTAEGAAKQPRSLNR